MYDYNKYRAYIVSTEWRKKADIIKELDGNCLVCHWIRFDAEYPEVHHLTYERLFHERMTDLATLCQACHNDVTLEWKSGKSLDAALEIVCSRFRNSVAKIKSKLDARPITDEARLAFGLKDQQSNIDIKIPKSETNCFWVVSCGKEHRIYDNHTYALTRKSYRKHSGITKFRSKKQFKRWLKDGVKRFGAVGKQIIIDCRLTPSSK